MKYLLIIALIVTSFACGVDYTGTGFGSTAEQAMDRAWTQAVTQMAIAQHPGVVDLTSYSNERLKGTESERAMVVHIEKLDLSGVTTKESKIETIPDGFRATKTVSGECKLKVNSNAAEKIEPYHYAKSLGNPKVRIGMSKTELLLKFGEPSKVTRHWNGDLLIAFVGAFCVGMMDTCFVWLKNDAVSNYEDFNVKYTEDLK